MQVFWFWVMGLRCTLLLTFLSQVADIIPPEVESSQTNKSPEHSTQDGQTTASSTHSPKPAPPPPPPPKEGGGKVLSMMASMPQVSLRETVFFIKTRAKANLPLFFLLLSQSSISCWWQTVLYVVLFTCSCVPSLVYSNLKAWSCRLWQQQ